MDLRRFVTTVATAALATGGALAITATPAASIEEAPVLLFTTGLAGTYTTDPVPAGICFVTIRADGGHGGAGAASDTTPGLGGVGAAVAARVASAPGSACPRSERTAWIVLEARP